MKSLENQLTEGLSYTTLSPVYIDNHRIAQVGKSSKVIKSTINLAIIIYEDYYSICFNEINASSLLYGFNLTYCSYGHFLYLEIINIRKALQGRIMQLIFYEFRNVQNTNVISPKSSLNLVLHFQAKHCILLQQEQKVLILRTYFPILFLLILYVPAHGLILFKCTDNWQVFFSVGNLSSKTTDLFNVQTQFLSTIPKELR